MLRRVLPALVLAALATGCGGDDGAGPTTASGPGDAPSTREGTSAPRTAPDDAARTTPGGGSATAAVPAPAGGTSSDADPPPASWDASCPTATRSPMGCRAVRGRVLAIQSYDPDGDGDLHVVAIGGGVTAPGITVFDVRDTLRPRRDPRPGEFVTGAGPVFRGSLRQRQIQVDTFRVWRP